MKASPTGTRGTGETARSWEGATSLFGILLALLLLAGRWGPARLAGEGIGLPQLRWALLLLLCLVSVLSVVGRPLHRERAGGSLLAADRRMVLLHLLLLFAFLLASALWAPRHEAVAGKATDLAMMLATVVAVGMMADDRGAAGARRWFWVALVGGTGVLALLALIHLALAGPLNAMGRLSVLGGGPNVFGRNMGLLVLGCLHLAARGRGRVLWLLGATLAGGLVLVSGSRGAMLATLCGAAVQLMGEGRRGAGLARRMAGALAIGWLLLRHTGPGRLVSWALEQRVVNLLLRHEGGGVYLSGRDELYERALALGDRLPAFGGGLGGYPARGLGVYPHNLFLEVYAEAGLCGLALLVILLIWTGAFLLRHGRYLPPRDLGALILLLVSAQFSGDLYNSFGFFLLLMLCTLARSGARNGAARAAEPGGPGHDLLCRSA